MSRTVPEIVRQGIRASVPAAVLSTVPSTLHAVLTGRDPLEAALAAGSILRLKEHERVPMVTAAVPVHLSLSVAWAIVLAIALPRERPMAEGIAAGLLIATLDLGVVGRRFPRVRALRIAPQIADHVAFGIVVAIALARLER